MRKALAVALILSACRSKGESTDTSIGSSTTGTVTTGGTTTGGTYGTGIPTTGGGTTAGTTTTTTGTSTGGTIGSARDGTYVGTLDMMIDFIPMYTGTPFYGYCQGTATITVDSTANPPIQGTADCDATLAGLGVLAYDIVGDSPVDPYAGGEIELYGYGRSDNWVGMFDTDTLTGSFADSGPAFGGFFNYDGTFVVTR